MTAFLILFLFAVIFCGVGGVLLYFRSRERQKAMQMRQARTSGASGVSGMSPGTQVEVKGVLRCEELLASEMAGAKCAYYSARVTREYLKPDRGNSTGSDRRSETVAHNERSAPFFAEDETAGPRYVRKAPTWTPSSSSTGSSGIPDRASSLSPLAALP